MPHLQKSSATGHLLRTASGHLRLKHPGYTFTRVATSCYFGQSTGYYEIAYENEDYDWVALYQAEAAQLSAAIASMVSSAGSMSEIQAGWGSGSGGVYPVWGSAGAAGFIYEVAAVGGAPFGSPVCDLTATLVTGNSGFSGQPYCNIGTGATMPNGNPGGWGGAWTRTATSTLTGFSLGRYVWISGWFTSTSGVLSPYPVANVQFSLSAASIRY